jgi:hypothetical protein
MELDDLKLAWQDLDRRLDRQETWQRETHRRGQLDRMHDELKPLKRGQVVQWVSGVALALLFAPFWVRHRDTPHLFVVGLLLHAYALMFVVMAARTLVVAGRIDPAEPVLLIRRRIADLYAWRLREAWWFGVAGCLLWFPLTLYVFALMGADLYANGPYVLANVVFSVLLLGVFLMLTRSLRRLPTRWSQWLEDSAVGASVRRARERIDELARFDGE